MNKVWLIIRREYLTRVKKRSFIIVTLITPLAIAAFGVLVGFIMSYQGDEERRIAIVDEGNLLNGAIKDEEKTFYSFPKATLETLKSDVSANKYSGVLVIPRLVSTAEKTVTLKYYSDDQLGMNERDKIADRIEEAVRDYKITNLQLDKTKLDALGTDVDIDPEPIKEGSKNESKITAAVSMGIGSFLGIIMYMSVFIYGSMVMRSVMEEKTTRVVEVLASSVKPYQLMLGKIIGVGAVGLTQLLIWGILIPTLSIIFQLVFGINGSPDTVAQMQGMQGMQQVNPDDWKMSASQVFTEIGNMRWWLIIPLSAIYFVCGYFLYASLFAAVGSAINEDLGEAQQLTLPISMPAILGFYVMFTVVRAPESGLAIFGSIFPLFSPIVMPALLTFNPPWWQILISVTVLLATTAFFVWLSARIYRVGILMYGKKPSFKEMAKWVFFKD